MIVLPSIGYPALLPETLAQLDQPYFDGFDAAVQLLCQLVHGRPDDIFARVRRMGALGHDGLTYCADNCEPIVRFRDHEGLAAMFKREFLCECARLLQGL